MSTSDQEYVTIARVSKTQGRRGEVACTIYTDFPEKFAERERVFLWNPKAQPAALEAREMTVQEHWFHKGMVVLKFAGIDSITEAESLLGSEVRILEEERTPLEVGAYYISDLSGCMLFDHGAPVGRITDVNTANGGVPLLIVERQDGEVEVPFAQRYLESVDLPAKQVRMNLPVGLLEVNS